MLVLDMEPPPSLAVGVIKEDWEQALECLIKGMGKPYNDLLHLLKRR